MAKTIKEVLNKDHWHFSFYAFDEVEIKEGRELMVQHVIIEVQDAQEEEEALARAKEKVKRRIYTLHRAWQCNQCLFQDDMVKAQQQMIRKMDY